MLLLPRSFSAQKMCLIAQVTHSKTLPISCRQRHLAFTTRNPGCFGSDFWRGFKLPEIWKAHRCDCVVFKARSSLEWRRQSEWLLAHTHPPSLSECPPRLCWLAHSGLTVPHLYWPLCVSENNSCLEIVSPPVAPCPWLHAEGNNVRVIFAWLQIAGSSGNGWSGATGLSLVDEVHYPHLPFTLIGLTSGMNGGAGNQFWLFSALKMLKNLPFLWISSV